MKYPYSLEGLVGFIPKINTFFSSKFDLFLLIAVISLFGFSIRWSAAKYIKGWLYGTSLISADAKIAGAVFFFAGSKIILYFLILLFFKAFFTSLRYFELVLIIG